MTTNETMDAMIERLGVCNGEKFESADAVREYLTTANVAETVGETFDQGTLDAVADYMIDNGIHMDDAHRVEWSDGRVTTHDSFAAARASVLAEHPDAEIGHDGDLSDGGERTLCWRNEDEAIDDDGAHAVATIRRGR